MNPNEAKKPVVEVSRQPIKVSVILCAHNPRTHHFAATLDGLRGQSFPLEDWELLIIDNASSPRLCEEWDISWHPNGRIVVEEEIGLARARRRGYLESGGRLIVHSDDDNILSENYLAEAWRIYEEHPHIGCFGGQWVMKFDQEPSPEIKRRICDGRQFTQAKWSNLPDDNRTMPFGAGMCIRSEVTKEYLRQVTADPRRLILGRTGDRFITGEDIDLNFIATAMGLGTGRFPALSLVHLTPPERTSEEHLIRYAAGNAYSMVILHWLHFKKIHVSKQSAMGAVAYRMRVWLRMDSYARRMELALVKARRDAIKDMSDWGWLKTD